MGAKEYVKADDKGVLFLKLVEAGDGGREEHLKEGEVQIFTMFLQVLNKPTEGAININTTGTEYTINNL
jgi:hypothetical protein